jgi:hypothetical protein
MQEKSCAIKDADIAIKYKLSNDSDEPGTMYEHFYDFCGINQTAGFNYISSAT